MLRTIIGDIVGSRFEFNSHQSKDFDLPVDANFCDKCGSNTNY